MTVTSSPLSMALAETAAAAVESEVEAEVVGIGSKLVRRTGVSTAGESIVLRSPDNSADSCWDGDTEELRLPVRVRPRSSRSRRSSHRPDVISLISRSRRT